MQPWAAAARAAAEVPAGCWPSVDRSEGDVGVRIVWGRPLLRSAGGPALVGALAASRRKCQDVVRGTRVQDITGLQPPFSRDADANVHAVQAPRRVRVRSD